MDENERLLNEIEHLKKLISKQKHLSEKSSANNKTTNVLRKQTTGANVLSVQLRTGEKDESVRNDPPRTSARSQYKWLAKAKEPLSNNAKISPESTRAQTKQADPPAIHTNIRTSTEHNKRNLSVSKGKAQPQIPQSQSSCEVVMSSSNSDRKRDAALFLKDKFGNRSVHINRHHATFSGNNPLLMGEHSAKKSKLNTPKANGVDRRKSAALSFLQTAFGRDESAALSKDSSTSSTFNKYKIDHRPVVPSPQKPKPSASQEKKGSRLVLKGKHKIVRTKLVPGVVAKKESGNPTVIPLTSGSGTRPVMRKQISRCEVVKKLSSTTSMSGSTTTHNQNAFTQCSKYKLVKRKAPMLEKSSGRSHNHKTAKSTSSKYKWTKIASHSDRPATSFVSPRTSGVFSSKRSHQVITPRSIKLKTRFKLVRKALKTSQETLLRLNETKSSSTPLRRRIKNSKYKLINKGGYAAPLLWKNRYSLKRGNSVGVVNINQLLGRKVVNISGNKYKFVSGSLRQNKKVLPARVLERKLKHSSKLSKFKLDRRVTSSPQARHNDPSVRIANFVMIGGILYKSSRRRLIKSEPRQADGNNSNKRRYSLRRMSNPRMRAIFVRGTKYEMDPSGRTLHRVKSDGAEGNSVKRIDIGGVTYLQTRPGTLVKASTQSKRIVASRSLHKSIARKMTLKKKREKKYCLFYNRFGKCNKGTRCNYIHDPEKIAVCTRFLRGTCGVSDCPFSHKVAKEKMPVCLHYLRGTCSRENCPYRHVKVSRDAEICEDFLNGYCPFGDMCNKQHTVVCLEFVEIGKCPRDGHCKLFHPGKSKKRDLSKFVIEGVPVGESARAKRPRVAEKCHEDDRHLPLSKRRLPSYIALSNSSNTAEVAQAKSSKSASEQKELEAKPLKIRPSFV